MSVSPSVNEMLTAVSPTSAAPAESYLFPLSYGQKRLWFIHQMDPKSSLYNIPLFLRLSGLLDRQALERALSEIVQRHEILRTTFPVMAGEPMQRVTSTVLPVLGVVDLSGLEPPAREQMAEFLRRDEALRPFDLERGPLIRLSLLRFDERNHQLLISMHHIVSDGWSRAIFARELRTLYSNFHRHAAPSLAPPRLQFADYSEWQNGWLKGKVLDRELDYWKRQLDDLPALEVLTDFPRTETERHPAGAVSFSLSSKLAVELRRIGQREKASMFMVLLAAFQWLLRQYTGEERGSVGTVIANRNRVEMEELIGFFVNTLVLRADTSGEVSFADLIRRVRQITLDAYAHQDLPFEKLVEELNPKRSLSRTPLFSLMFVVQNVNSGSFELEELIAAELRDAAFEHSKFDFTLILEPAKHEVLGELQYASDLYERASMQRLVRHYICLLEHAAANPEVPLSRLPLLDKDECQRLVVEWNATKADFPAQSSIHGLFEQQVAQTPDAIALTCQGSDLTYRELNARSNRLAHYLRSFGVGPEALVGIGLERSFDMVVGLLAILKAGGAYLPFDAREPAERLEGILSNVPVRAIVTTKSSMQALPSGTVPVICVDHDGTAIERYSDHNPDSRALPNNLAYVLYTSGSTGTPKGVEVAHQSVVRLVRGMTYVELRAGDVMLQFAPLSFDASTFEIWGALLNGARLVIAPPGTEGLDHLADVIADSRLTTMWITTALFDQLVNTRPNLFAGLRQVLTGGDVISPDSVRTAVERGCKVIACYGPTENTTFTTTDSITDAKVLGDKVPIGRPISNTDVYVLNADMELVPTGGLGELYIGGVGLARGYCADARMTAEKFVPHPFAGESDARLYRSGDIVRYRADGKLDFICRKDHQVKIRGYRVEPAEIEQALKRQSNVREAVVVLRTDGSEKRLAAYVVAEPEADIRVAALRQQLIATLPDYMIPTVSVLGRIPLTPSGKLDRRALPEPDPAQTETVSVPRTPMEKALWRIWSETLGVEHVGIDDNFFALGGHSLLATRMISQVRSELRVDVPLRAIFEHPTVAEFAAEMETRLKDKTLSGRPIVRVPRAGPLALSPAQRRLWFLQQLQPESAVYNVPLCLRIEGALHVQALAAALSAIVRRHELLRTTFPALDGEPVQLIHPAAALALPFIDLSALPEADRIAVAEELRAQDSDRPFDLAQGPLLRAALLRLSSESHELLLNCHHIVNDGWSLAIFARELRGFYRAFRDGSSWQPAELPVQYADYAAWRSAGAADEDQASQLEYWKKQLQKIPLAEIPTDYPRRQVAAHPRGMGLFRLSAAATRNLKLLGERESASLFMLLTAGLQWVISCYSGEKDITIGTVVANRRRAELEHLIGFFVNTLVLRTDVSGSQNLLELLHRVREVTLQAFAHQDTPFEKIVEEMSPERDLGRTPFFQAMLVLQNAQAEPWELSGLRVTEIPVPLRDAKFDFSISMIETQAGIEGQVDFASDLYEKETVEQLLRHYVRLLETAAMRPEVSLAEIHLLDDEERRTAVVKWNRSERLYPAELVPEIARQQAQRRGGATALVHEGSRLSYQELEERSNRLAHRLIQIGVSPELRVGVFLDRGFDLVTAILAIWKAGGVYVPLDTAYPKDRLAFMLEDASVGVLVSVDTVLPELPAHDARVLCLDVDWEEIEAQSSAPPELRIAPSNLAYVMYTSGSTGNPKGAMLEHGGMMNHLWSKVHDLGLTDRDVIAQNASASFDISIWQIFAALLVGGHVHIISDEIARDAFQLLDDVHQHEVTVLETVPTLLGLMIEQQLQKRKNRLQLNHLRWMISNAEALPANLCLQWRRIYPKVALMNTYGATECSDDTTHYVVQSPTDSRWTYAPLGLPIGNLKSYVLNEGLSPVPIGVAGEIYIGGAGVGRGYLARPRLTAERFVPDPFSSLPGARMYRTGDLARLRRDGQPEFVGRTDHQVKIRGNRVELGEIDAALLEHPTVSLAVSIVREDEPGLPRLVSYLVLRDAVNGSNRNAAEGRYQDPTASPEFRQRLAARLPDYMVPAAFVVLDSIPLTVNGKVDREVLPIPELSQTPSTNYIGPRNELETMLCDLWRQLLQIANVGILDNFFSLGGHSLLATQVIARIHNTLRLEIPLLALFQYPTVAGLAEEIERIRSCGGQKIAPVIVPARRDSFRILNNA